MPRAQAGRDAGCRAVVLASGLLAAWMLAAATPASGRAAAPLATGFAADEYGSPDAAVREEWLDRTVEAGAGIVRINVTWRSIATRTPADPDDPADPAYDFGATDAAVIAASGRGLQVLLTVEAAPDYAELGPRPAPVSPGAWRPSPAALAGFARALAIRYSGGFSGLPRVLYYQAWNEPNLDAYLAPQWVGGRPFAPGHYRALLNAFHDAVKGVSASNLVVSAGLAPYGEPSGGDRTRPLRFLRELFCLTRKLKPRSCDSAPQLDVLAHHPINTSGGPRRSAIHRDDASTPDLREVRRTLRAAERAGLVLPPGPRPIWATEIWWETNPPDGFAGVSLRRHARWIAEALYVLWKQGARVVINLQVRDAPLDARQPLATLQAGVFFENGRPKPALRAFRFPFVAELLVGGSTRRSPRVRLWGKAPEPGTVIVQQRGGRGWQRIRSVRAGVDGVFTGQARVQRGAPLRALSGGEASLSWRAR